MIEQDVSTANPLTPDVRGRNLLRSNIATFQVITSSATNENFIVHLEAATPRSEGEPVFVSIAVFDQDSDPLIAVPISYETRYRARHISGVAVHVIMVG